MTNTVLVPDTECTSIKCSKSFAGVMKRSLAIDFVIIIIVLYSVENNSQTVWQYLKWNYFSFTKISIDYIRHWISFFFYNYFLNNPKCLTLNCKVLKPLWNITPLEEVKMLCWPHFWGHSRQPAGELRITEAQINSKSTWTHFCHSYPLNCPNWAVSFPSPRGYIFEQGSLKLGDEDSGMVLVEGLAILSTSSSLPF